MNTSSKTLHIRYALLQMSYWATFGAFTGFQTVLFEGRGFTGSQIGLLVSMRYVAAFLIQPQVGGWADRHPQVPVKNILRLGFLGAAAVTVALMATRPGFLASLALVFCLGAFELNAYPLLDSIAVQYMQAGTDLKYSLLRGFGSISYATCCVLFGLQSQYVGVETLLITHLALLVLLQVVLAILPLPNQPRPTVSGETGQPLKPHTVWQILHLNRRYTLMLVALMFCMIGLLPLTGFMATIVTGRGGTDTYIGVALFLMAAAELPGGLLFSRLKDRFSVHRLLVFAIVCMFLRTALTFWAPNMALTLGVQITQLFGYGVYIPAAVMFTRQSMPQQDTVRSQTIMMVACIGLGGSIGNLMAGAIAGQFGVQPMLGACLVFNTIGVVLALASLRVPTTPFGKGAAN